MAISRPRVLAIAQRKYYLLVEVPMHIMHTAATTRPYLSRRQNGTQRFVSRVRQRTNARRAQRPAELIHKTRAGRAVQCRARFHDGRALGQPSRTVEPNEGSDRREIRSTRVNSTIEKSADWGSSAMHCVIYISTTRPEFGRPTLAERSVYSKCVVPNNGLIVSLPRPP